MSGVLIFYSSVSKILRNRRRRRRRRAKLVRHQYSTLR